jgi:hypothetical protein
MTRTRKREPRPELPVESYDVTIHRDAETGVAVREAWGKDGKRHRVDGPALIKRDPVTGIVVQESWFRENEVHREDGPADILRKAETGRIYYSAWYRNGVKIPPPPEARTTLRSSSRRHLPPSGEMTK